MVFFLLKINEIHMEKLQCSVCGIDNGILGEIVKRLLVENHIEVHDCAQGFDNLLNAPKNDNSYVIVGKGNKQLPVEYREVFNQNNNLIVIELLSNGKSLSLYMSDVNEVILNKIINLNMQ